MPNIFSIPNLQDGKIILSISRGKLCGFLLANGKTIITRGSFKTFQIIICCHAGREYNWSMKGYCPDMHSASTGMGPVLKMAIFYFVEFYFQYSSGIQAHVCRTSKHITFQCLVSDAYSAEFRFDQRGCL